MGKNHAAIGVVLLLASCSIREPQPAGGTNLNLCAFFAVCNFHGTTARTEGDGSEVKQKTQSEQKGSLSVSPK